MALDPLLQDDTKVLQQHWRTYDNISRIKNNMDYGDHNNFDICLAYISINRNNNLEYSD
jgi:hypothetical protein